METVAKAKDDYNESALKGLGLEQIKKAEALFEHEKAQLFSLRSSMAYASFCDSCF